MRAEDEEDGEVVVVVVAIAIPCGVLEAGGAALEGDALDQIHHEVGKSVSLAEVERLFEA